MWQRVSFLIVLVLFSTCANAKNDTTTDHLEVSTRNITTTCTTPNNETGTCIALSTCKVLYDKIQTADALVPSTIQFFRNSQCGRNGSTVYVCCGITDQQNNSSDVGTFNSTPIAFKSAQRFQCGQSERNGIDVRVVGATPAELGAWPWMAALYCTNQRSGKAIYHCGGSLISDQWVITAAHCRICSEKYRDLILTHLRLGDLDLDDDVADNATYIEVQIKEILLHPDYRRTPMENDIALLRLSQPVEFTNYIKPVCLLSGKEYESEDFYDKKKPYTAGWGFTDSRHASKTHLFQTSVPIVNSTRCIQNYATFSKEAVVDSRVLCAGDDKRDSCSGDSGGPLMFPDADEKTYFLGGIVSFGVRCAEPNYPGVYTRVASFIDWINNSTGLSF